MLCDIKEKVFDSISMNLTETRLGYHLGMSFWKYFGSILSCEKCLRRNIPVLRNVVSILIVVMLRQSHVLFLVY